MRVTIDGIEYIPAKEAIANRIEIAKGLLIGWWGKANDKDAQRFINDTSIRVDVNDNGHGITLAECLDNIAKEL